MGKLLLNFLEFTLQSVIFPLEDFLRTCEIGLLLLHLAHAGALESKIRMQVVAICTGCPGEILCQVSPPSPGGP